MTSTPVTISIILDRFQIDAVLLIQAERKEKALRTIQKKIMHARSTLDWSQSINISCYFLEKACSVWFAVFVREWGLVVFFFYFFDECLFLCTGDA